MRSQTLIISTLLLALFLPSGFSQTADVPPIIGGARARPKPQRPLQKADVVVDWQNILDDCSTEKICIQGGLYNQGPEMAENVKLRVDIGSHNLSRPRMSKSFNIDSPTLNPGDRQEYFFELERKIPYKDSKGKMKILEVGKYNFKVTPVWGANKPKKSSKQTRKNRNS